MAPTVFHPAYKEYHERKGKEGYYSSSDILYYLTEGKNAEHMDNFPKFSILVLRVQIHLQSPFVVAHPAHFTWFCLESKSLLKKQNREAGMPQDKSLLFDVIFTSKTYDVQICLGRHITLTNQKVKRLQPSSPFRSVHLSPLKLKRYTEVFWVQWVGQDTIPPFFCFMINW